MPTNTKALQVAEPAALVAGKNKIINGDFGVWQRGTSFTPSTNDYSADRFKAWFDGTGATRSITQQTFTLGSAPVAGYEGTYYLRYAQTVAGTGATYNNFGQKLEDVRTFAGQTATFSFWARVSSGTISLTAYCGQEYSSGATYTQFGSWTVTTSWQRFTGTAAIPSIAGKTLGATPGLPIYFGLPTNAAFTLDLWGIQYEAGSVATPFTTATGNPQAELAACQRYYAKTYNQGTAPGTATAASAVVGYQVNANQAATPFVYWALPVVMRTSPTLTGYSKNTGTSGKMSAGGTDYNFATNSSVNGDKQVCAYPATTVAAVVDCYYQMTADAEL